MPTPEEELNQLRTAVAERDQLLAQERADAEMTRAALEEMEQQLPEDVRPYLERLRDPQTRELFDTAIQGRDLFNRQHADEQAPAWAKPLFERVEKVDKFVDTLTKREQDAAQRQELVNRNAAKAWTDSATSYMEKLTADAPEYFTGKKFQNGDIELTDDGMMMVNSVSVYARKHSLSFEDAYKRVGARFKPDGAKTPPSSMPADSSDPGIPSGEERRPAEGETNFADELERRLSASVPT